MGVFGKFFQKNKNWKIKAIIIIWQVDLTFQSLFGVWQTLPLTNCDPRRLHSCSGWIKRITIHTHTHTHTHTAITNSLRCNRWLRSKDQDSSVLPCVAVCCSLLQCSALQCVAVRGIDTGEYGKQRTTRICDHMSSTWNIHFGRNDQHNFPPPPLSPPSFYPRRAHARETKGWN